MVSRMVAASIFRSHTVERQHVQARVRAAMDAQVINEGRHQGGRAPYGYKVVDGGPHPNPRKAAEGYRLRVLAIEEETADVVRRIFAEYLDGTGDRAIAHSLNVDGIPCPSANRPEQNRHRLADGWQGSTVRAILENPRYTGYAIFGRWTKHETLLDPDDVAAGHVVRFRRSSPDRVVRSRRPAHPEIVSVDTFTQARLMRRSRAAGGMRGRGKLDRRTFTTRRPYRLRGRFRCNSLMAPSWLMSILCDGLRWSYFPPNSGTQRSTPYAANFGAINENWLPNQQRLPSPTTTPNQPRSGRFNSASSRDDSGRRSHGTDRE
jgi:hypothetical protein